METRTVYIEAPTFVEPSPVYYTTLDEKGNRVIAGYRTGYSYQERNPLGESVGKPRRSGLATWQFDIGADYIDDDPGPKIQWKAKWSQPRKVVQLSDLDPDLAMVAQIAHIVADDPYGKRKARYRVIGRRTKAELFSIAAELGYEALVKYPLDSNTFERIHGYVLHYLPKACRKFERKDHPSNEIPVSTDFMNDYLDLTLSDYDTRPVDIELAKKTWRRAKRTGMKPHPHYGKRHRWQLESPAIEKKVERLTLVKVFGETSLNDMVVFALAGLDGNNRDAAARIGVSPQRFSEAYRAARTRFYERYYDPKGTGETLPPLHR